MNWKRTARWSWLVLPFLLLALWPGLALAFNATLYEVTESMKAKGGTITRRVATASLMGRVNGGTAICPVFLVGVDGKCDIVAIATDNIKINMATGKAVGPVDGTFAVVVNEPGSVDAPEAVVIRGTLRGKINLSPAVVFAGTGGAAGVPLGTIEGRWSAHGVKGTPLEGFSAHGTFTGVFRLPILLPGTEVCLADENPADCPFFYYFGAPTDAVLNVLLLGSSGGLGVPLGGDERSLEAATVRLDVTFE